MFKQIIFILIWYKELHGLTSTCVVICLRNKTLMLTAVPCQFSGSTTLTVLFSTQKDQLRLQEEKMRELTEALNKQVEDNR